MVYAAASERNFVVHVAALAGAGQGRLPFARRRAGRAEITAVVAAEVAAAGSDGRLLAHIDGRIIAVQVAAGATVTRGQPLVVLEAMKMEFQLAAPIDGRVEAVEIAVGDQVRIRQRLLQITPDA